jgi:hypothetical protein
VLRRGRARYAHLILLRRPIGPIFNSYLRRENKLQYDSRSDSRSRFMWCSVKITVPCGDGAHSITVSQKAFAEIRGGKEITL